MKKVLTLFFLLTLVLMPVLVCAADGNDGSGSIITQIITGALGIIFSIVGLKLPSWINSTKKKNQAIQITTIAHSLVAMAIMNNPNIPWLTILDQVTIQLQGEIEGLNPKIAKRAVADALYAKGVIGAKVEANK